MKQLPFHLVAESMRTDSVWLFAAACVRLHQVLVDATDLALAVIVAS